MAANPENLPATQQQPLSLLAKFASRYNVEAKKMLDTLKATAFRQRDNQPEVTNEQMVSLLVVADQYGLNPFTREIYAFADKGGIVPVVGVDGWMRIMNEHPQFDGVDFVDGEPGKDGLPAWIECRIYRKDRSRPVVVREYMAECKRGTGPWGSHPRRMLRHKALIQGNRIAFGFVGIFDADEADAIVQAGGRVRDITPRATAPSVSAINEQITSTPAPAIEHAPAETVAPMVPSQQSMDTMMQSIDADRVPGSDDDRA